MVGMMTKPHACSVLINISMLVEKYGDMNKLLQIEALNTAAMVVRAIIGFHKEVFSEEEEDLRTIKTQRHTALNFSNNIKTYIYR